MLRWKHPIRGEISPAVFIPIAEEFGAILQIGDWVLKTACREAATWTHPLQIAVNVSAVQLYNAFFVRELQAPGREVPACRRTGSEIEITETALVRDFNRALGDAAGRSRRSASASPWTISAPAIVAVQPAGLSVRPDQIDQSFIKSVNSNGQAATIVRQCWVLACGLGLPVLAEGVETAAELKFLQDESCDAVQGYLLGRPAAIGNFRQFTHGDVVLDADADAGLRPMRRA